VAARSKAWVCGCSLAGMAGSNPVEGEWHRCLSLVSVVVLSGRGLCVGMTTRPEESYRVWCVSEYDREASILRRRWPTGGCCAIGGKKFQIIMTS
jgi:hypothetical protein